MSIKVFCINNEDIRCLMNDGHDSFSCPQKSSPGSPALRGELQCIARRVGNWSLPGFPAPKNIHSFAYNETLSVPHMTQILDLVK